MNLILNIDTSTKICSVNLSEGDKIISIKENKEGRNHAKLLSVFIEEIFEEQNIPIKKLDAIAISKGPGSYTGLRIGVSTAKGISYGLSIPLISVNTLKMMASGYLQTHPDLKNEENIILCPMIDARRMEVYSALYNNKLEEVRKVEAEIIDINSYQDILSEKKLIIFGDGAEKCEKTLNHKNITIDKEFSVSSRFMASLSLQKFEQKIFEDVAYFEPFYLKDFVATQAKKKILP